MTNVYTRTHWNKQWLHICSGIQLTKRVAPIFPDYRKLSKFAGKSIKDVNRIVCIKRIIVWRKIYFRWVIVNYKWFNFVIWSNRITFNLWLFHNFFSKLKMCLWFLQQYHSIFYWIFHVHSKNGKQCNWNTNG